jgi:uncharacterized membrane protein
VIAAILWIGDSFLFMWMDRSLVKPTRPREGAVSGELWMVHSGGFYEVVKRTKLLPHELPASLHWFKWEAYTTWITGVFLLGIVYFLGGGVYLVDSSVSRIGLPAAIAVSLGSLALGWLVYDALWRSPLARNPRLAAGVSYALIVALAWALTRLVSGRAAFVLVGATLGTLMVANVWRVIIPGQAKMLAATRAGQEVDIRHGQRAKTRSTHNHYLTLPVLFTMLSQHYPATYGHPLNWVILALLVLFGAAAKYVMNERGRSHPAIVLGGLAALVATIWLTTATPRASANGAEFSGAPPVRFAEVRAILERRCVSCHAARPANPSFPQPPGGVVLEEPERIHALSDRILARAVVTKTMPLGNLTGMTDEERRTLGAWIAQGARVEE